MDDKNIHKIHLAQAAAWRKIGTYATTARTEFHKLPQAKQRDLLNIELLLIMIEKEKAALEKLIDSLPD